jgi:DNA-binding CsgD family transcriptional regulator
MCKFLQDAGKHGYSKLKSMDHRKLGQKRALKFSLEPASVPFQHPSVHVRNQDLANCKEPIGFRHPFSGRSFGEAFAPEQSVIRSTVLIERENSMMDLKDMKVTQRDEQVLKLLLQGCSNKEIGSQLNISPRTVKQHLRTLFLRAGIRDGRKRVKLATAMFLKEQESCNLVNG